MGVLEKVMQMKQSGNTESQIINYLMREGVSPREINEALSQSQIKQNLVANFESGFGGPQAVSEMPAQATPESQMKPSVMQNPEENQNQLPPEQQYSSQMQERAQMKAIPSSFQPSTAPLSQDSQMQGQEMQPPQSEEYSYPQDYSQQAPYPQSGYPQSEYAQYPQYSPVSDIETINEIAEQIAEEKVSKIKNEMIKIVQFCKEIELETEKAGKKIEKIENTLNELQISILGKIGGYGRNIESIEKEMRATQDSFSKVLNPLTDNIRKLQKINEAGKTRENPEEAEPMLQRANASIPEESTIEKLEEHSEAE